MTQTRIRKAALAAACGLLPALVLTGCNKSVTTTTSQPAPPTTAGTTATADAGSGSGVNSGKGAKIAAATALTPEQWGKGFTKDDPYENNSLEYYVTNASCQEQLGQAPASLSGAMTRNVKVPNPEQSSLVNNLGWTSITVFGVITDAEKDFTDGKSSSERCPSWSNADGSAKGTGEHLAAAPTIPFADETYAVEGTVRYQGDAGGSLPHYTLTARKGSITLSASLDGTEGSSTAQLRAQVQSAMSAMLVKLKAQGQ